ncbi:MAG: TadE family protein [Alphaproteobacteria bacterium]
MVTTFPGLVRPDQGGVGRLRVDAVRRFARCNKGISSVEFVIILPLLMLFLFGIITFASALYIQVNMENAAREAARRMAVAEAPAAGVPVSCSNVQATTPGTAEYYACTYLADWPVNFEVDADVLCPANRDVIVTVTVSAEQVALADIFGFFYGKTLTAEVVMRREGECV